jgi:AcrR family transcriptional regulator
MLDAGVEVFAELSLDELLAEIGPRRVVRHLGDVTPGAFYHHFPSRAHYLDELAGHALAPGRDEIAPETADMLFEVANLPDTDVVGHMERICNRDFERLRTDGRVALQLQMCLWAKHDDRGAREILRFGYDGASDHIAPAFERILERWGREFRPPFTMSSALMVFVALLEGLVVRHCVDPKAVSPTLFAEAVVALLPTMTRPVGDEADLGDALASISRFEHGPRSRPADSELRRRVLDAVAARADSDPAAQDDASIEEVADDAGVPADAVYAEFHGKPGLAAAAFARYLPLLERPLRTELEDGLPPVEVIRAHLRRLADVTVRHRGLANALYESALRSAIRYGTHIGPSDPRAVVPLPQLLTPTVRAGQTQGVIRDDFDAFELAALVTSMLFLRVMSRPQESAEQIAEIVSEVALRGISSPR